MKTKEDSSRKKSATRKTPGAKKTSATKKAAPQAVEAKTAIAPAPLPPVNVVPVAAIRPADEIAMAAWYIKLRKAIGWLGTVLPFAVSLGAWLIFREPLQGSISGYYYTHMRDVLVGTLFAIGFFLYSYEYDRPDGIAAKFAFVFALCVALFPTDPTETTTVIGTVHLVSAALFFLTLSYFCLFLFTKTHSGGFPPMSARKKQRNILYRVCGGLMILCIVLMGIYHLAGLSKTPVAALNPIYWLEAIAIVAFGVSWLAKGEAILKDEE